MKILGIDEAGRGPLIGPMIIAGVLVNNDKEIRKMGVKDSKALTRKKRQEIFDKLTNSVEYSVERVSAQEIDMLMSSGTNLNQIEAIHMAKIINKTKPDKVIIDAVSGKKKFFNFMKKFLKHNSEIILEHKADVNFPVVSAASIIAKQIRDSELDKIGKKFGIELGVGYTHDERSIKSVRDNLKNDEFLKHVTKSWITFSRIKKEKEQKGLMGYFEQDNRNS